MGSSLSRQTIQALLRHYQSRISPLLPARCRFYPSCSQYAYDAFGKYGLIKAMMKSTWRIARCHPFSRGGVDLP